MRVSIAPWEIVDTSVVPRRRRRRDKSVCTAPLCEEPTPWIRAEFVHTRPATASSKRKQRHNDNWHAALTLTATHRVCVLGKQKGEAKLSEHADWHYLVPPDDAHELRQVPACLDARHEYMFAIRAGNKVMGWSLSQAIQDAHVAELPSVAIDLHLVPNRRCWGYGVMEDGRVFVVRAADPTTKDATLQLSVYDLPEQLKTVSLQSIGSFAETVATKAGTKRPAADDAAESVERVCTVYHAILCNNDVVLRRIVLDDSMSLTDEGMFRCTLPNTKGMQSVNGRLLGVVAARRSVAFVMTLRNPSTPTNGFAATTKLCVSISMQTGRLCAPPFVLPTRCHQPGVVGGSLLASLANDDSQIHLYDLQCGALVHCIDVSAELSAQLDDCILVTDAKRGRLALMFENDNRVQTALTSASWERTNAGRMPLAVGLRSALQVSLSTAAFLDVGNFLAVQRSPTGAAAAKQKQHNVRDAIALFANLCAVAKNDGMTDFEQGSLMNTFEAAINLACGIELQRSPKTESPTAVANGQGTHIKDAKKTKFTNGEQKNGVHRSNGKREAFPDKSATSLSGRGVLPLATPIQFVQAAAAVVFALVAHGPQPEAHTECRVVVKRLLRSGRVSARHDMHAWGGSLSQFLHAVTRCHTSSNVYRYTALQCAFDVCQHCTDVTERHMVEMLHTVLLASGQDASIFLMSKRFDKQTHDLAKTVRDNEIDTDNAASRLVLKVSAMFLGKILDRCTENCNEVLLRSAVSDVLSAAEVNVLLSLLSRQQDSRACRCWIAALSDYVAANGMLSSLTMERLERSSHRVVNATSALVELRPLVEHVITLLEDTDATTATAPAPVMRLSMHIHPYQLERLRF